MMAEALRETLLAYLRWDPRVRIFCQDVEDPEEAFFDPRSLCLDFRTRVRLLSSNGSIVMNAAVECALAGGRPVAIIHCTDVVQGAFDRLARKLESMALRATSHRCASVVVLAPRSAHCAGFQPVPNRNFDATSTQPLHIDVVTPSSADEAARMLSAALADRRPTVLLYPRADTTVYKSAPPNV